MAGLAGMGLAATVLVDLDAAGRSAVLDVANWHQATHKGGDVDRPGPEAAPIRRGEHVCAIAQVHLQSVAARKARILKMKHEELGASGGGCVGEGVRPDVWWIGCCASTRANLDRWCYR